MAHHGVLFLDELPEFQATVLDALRQPLETGEVVIARANHHIRYPAKFQLVAAMNPCRCGYLADASRACSRAPICGKNYVAKLSGPLLDRFDLIIDVTALPVTELLIDRPSPSTAEIAEKVANAHIFGAHLPEDSRTLTPEIKGFLTKTIEKLDITGRGYEKIMRVARTIANLDNSAEIQKHHIQEAIAYRKMRLVL